MAKQEKVDESEPLVKTEEKELKKYEGGFQDIKDKIDIQKPEVKRTQPKDIDKISTVEVVKQTAIQVPRSSQLSPPSSVSQLAGINSASQEPNGNKQVQEIKESTSQMQKLPEQLQPQPRKSIISEPQEEQIRIPSDIVRQEKIHESESLVKGIEIIQKSPIQQHLGTHFFTESLRKGETQTAKIAKDIALIKKKIDEHISKEQPEPVRPVFLPKRPASRNLGGWSNLERNYVR